MRLIDVMLIGNSFMTIDHPTDANKKQCLYIPSFIQEWYSVVAVSGTVSREDRDQLKADFGQIAVLEVPTMREREQAETPSG